MSDSDLKNGPARFSWRRDDLECKVGAPAGRFTRVNSWFCFIVAAVLAVAFYGGLWLIRDTKFSELFIERGPFQYVAVLVAFWALVTVLVKAQKIRVQRKALELSDLTPTAADFVLSPATVDEVLGRLRAACDEPERFILFRRVEMALGNLKNMGQVADLDNVLESLANNDEDIMESSYTLIRGLIWMIPVLGFVGTVQGLSQAIGKFGGVLAEADNINQLRPVLQGVTAGLATAFDTTFVALICALTIQLVLIGVRKAEEELMVDCKTYCQKHLIRRLRLLPLRPMG